MVIKPCSGDEKVMMHGRPRILTREVIAVANLPVLFLITFHVSEMTYNVLMGTLNPTHSLTHSLLITFNNQQHDRTVQNLLHGRNEK